MIVPFIISFLISFISLWLLVTLFDHGINDKIKRISLLALVLVIVSTLGKMLGILGALFAAIINLMVIMKFLGYDFLTAFMFSIGLELAQYLIISGLLVKL